MNALQNNDRKLIFPICGKRYYNTVSHTRDKKESKGDNEDALAKSWEGDGSAKSGVKSSIDVLINWLTTEENASKYFGGLDIEGRMNTTITESYHYHIGDLIQKENGSERNAESIRSKIGRVLSFYKPANEQMNMTCNGLEGI